MKRQYFVFTILIAVLLFGILIWSSTQSIPQADKKGKHSAPLPKEIIITLDENGFTPNEVTINTGTAVRWKNISGKEQTVNSDDYPTNQLHKELNFGIFNDGSSVVYTFTKPGIYGYHNQFHPEQKGEIIVKE